MYMTLGPIKMTSTGDKTTLNVIMLNKEIFPPEADMT